MSLLDRFRKKRPRIEDPLFGALTYEPPSWTGRMLFRPCSREVAVSIESDERGPSDQQRGRFRELEEKYPGLLPLIGAALWELYGPVRADLEGDHHTHLGPSSASGMVEHTELFGIDLRHDGGIELGYGFDREVGWDDAMFNVTIDGSTPRPISLDD